MKPGALRQGTGSLSNLRVKAMAVWMTAGSVAAVWMISTSGICGTGLKKCRPASRLGSARRSARCSSTMLEVLVARMAPGFMRGSSEA